MRDDRLGPQFPSQGPLGPYEQQSPLGWSGSSPSRRKNATSETNSASRRGIFREGKGRDVLFWFGFLLVAFVGASIWRKPLLAFLALAIALVLGTALIWRRLGTRNLSYQRVFLPNRAFPGDEVFLGISLENAKLLPLPWAEIREQLPLKLDLPGVELEAVGDETDDEDGARTIDHQLLRALFSLWPYERIEQRYRVRCDQRGRFRIGPSTVAISDAFGIAVREFAVETTDDLLVYPQLRPLSDFGLPFDHPFGDEKPAQPLWEDPLRFKAVRDYDPADPPRRIHWRATARTGRLLSKVFEPGASGALAIFLDLYTFEQEWDEAALRTIEGAISAAASLVADGLSHKRQVGLYSNAPLLTGERFLRLPITRARVQLSRTLESLALLIPHALLRIEPMLLGEARRLPRGTVITVISLNPSNELLELLERLLRAGRPVCLLLFGNQPSRRRWQARRGLVVYDCRVPEEPEASEDSANEIGTEARARENGSDGSDKPAESDKPAAPAGLVANRLA